MDALTQEHLLDLEHRGWESLCNNTGGTHYGTIMTPEAVMVLTNGMTLDRDIIAASLNESPPWASFEITNAQLIPTGSDSAALVYTASATRDGQDEPFVALMTSVYRLVDGEPRLALYQQTTRTH